MFSAISRTNAVLHCAACSKLRGGTKRVLVRSGTDALAIAAIPQAGTLALPRSTMALRMITPILAIRQRCSVGAAEFTTTIRAAWPAYRVEARAAAPIGSHIREREFTRSFLLLRGLEGKARRREPTEVSNFATRIGACPGVHKWRRTSRPTHRCRLAIRLALRARISARFSARFLRQALHLQPTPLINESK